MGSVDLVEEETGFCLWVMESSRRVSRKVQYERHEGSGDDTFMGEGTGSGQGTKGGSRLCRFTKALLEHGCRG